VKVGYVTPSISPHGGGLMDSVRREASALSNRLTVAIFAGQDALSAAHLREWVPLDVSLFPVKGPSRFSYAPGLSQSLLDAQLDVISGHGLWRYTSLATARWHSKAAKPYIVSPHGMLDPWALRNSRSRKAVAAVLFENRHLRTASCIRALCASEVEAVKGYGLRNPVALIPNGVDLPGLEETVVAPWNEVEGFPGAKVLLSLGRIHPKKNLLALLQAWKGAQQSQPLIMADWRLVIGGWNEGSYCAQLREYIEESELERSVWLAGPLFGRERHAAYRNASGFVIPSLSEGLPMVVLEAWSYALPVIMTPACNLPEGFVAGAAIQTGETPAEISVALQQLANLPDKKRLATGQLGRALCADKFSWQAIAPMMEAVFRWILAGGSRPECIYE
jgi:glycosyltransferase involved in cell wall biosynthesis